jgi:hypothetical protein
MIDNRRFLLNYSDPDETGKIPDSDLHSRRQMQTRTVERGDS